jgi:pyridoxamine 5'-phosphate oxidase
MRHDPRMTDEANDAGKDLQPDMLDVASLRRDYLHAELRRADLDPDPIRQFHNWLEEAAATTLIREATAMVLSTAGKDGVVSSRVVLLKGYGPEGFRFFTNAASRKGRQIADNPSVSLLFHWEALERQIQINGSVTPLPRSETETYFATRPRGSRIGAWASRQSEVLLNRETLDSQTTALEKHFAGMEIPTPELWSGYLVNPRMIEFWQGRSNRLHDRFRYSIEGSAWLIERLSP